MKRGETFGTWNFTEYSVSFLVSFYRVHLFFQWYIRALQVEHETLFAALFRARMAYVGKTKVENIYGVGGVVGRVLGCHACELRFDSS